MQIRSRRPFRPEVLLSLVGVAACSPVETPTPTTLFMDSAGILIAESKSDRAAWDTATAWRLSANPIVRIGKVDADEPGVLLDEVRHARRLENGHIAVASSGTRDVRVFGADGRHIETIGRRGDGPGEFREPWLVFGLPGDSLLVVDLTGRLTVFDHERAYGRSFRVSLPSRELQSLEPIGMFADGTLLYRAHHLEDPQWTGTVRSTMRLLRYDLEGDLIGALGDYADQTLSLTPNYRGPVLYGPWAKAAPGRSSVWYGPGDRFEVREINLVGDLQRLVRLDIAPRQVTDEDVASVFEVSRARYRGTSREQAFERMISEMTVAHVKPPHSEMLIDADSNLWVQEYEYAEVRLPVRWHVFAEDGTYLGVVVAPAGFQIYQIGRDFVLGHWTDELEVEYVVMYGLEKPGI